jgi:hypothetical protein
VSAAESAKVHAPQEADHGHQKKFDSVADVPNGMPMRGETASARFSGTIWRRDDVDF